MVIKIEMELRDKFFTSCDGMFSEWVCCEFLLLFFILIWHEIKPVVNCKGDFLRRTPSYTKTCQQSIPPAIFLKLESVCALFGLLGLDIEKVKDEMAIFKPLTVYQEWTRLLMENNMDQINSQLVRHMKESSPIKTVLTEGNSGGSSDSEKQDL
ncbi:unnamed protein product [Caretta caretta]